MLLYRRGAHTPMNFTPRPQDTIGPYYGLSFSSVHGPERNQEIETDDLHAPLIAVHTPIHDPEHEDPDHYSIRVDNDPEPHPLLVAWAEARAHINPNTWDIVNPGPPPANIPNPTVPVNTTVLDNAWVQQIN